MLLEDSDSKIRVTYFARPIETIAAVRVYPVRGAAY